MIRLVLVPILITISYSLFSQGLHIQGDSVDVYQVWKILNEGLQSEGSSLEVSKSDDLYELVLRGDLTPQQPEEALTYHVLKYIIDYDGEMKINVVRNRRDILIGYAKKMTIDIGDIDNIEGGEEGDFYFTKRSVLIHELFEQFHLQKLQKVDPSKASARELFFAHNAAVQKESNYVNTTYLREEASINGPGYMRIRFNHRQKDAEMVEVTIHHKNNNVEGVTLVRK